MKPYRRMIPYLVDQWPGLALIVMLTALTSVVTALQPWPLKILVDYALGEEPVPAWLGGPFADGSPALLIGAAASASVLIFILSNLLDVGVTWTWAVSGQRMIRRLAARLFSHMLTLSLAFHQGRMLGDLLDRLTTDTWAIYKVADEILIGPAQRLVTFATVGAVAWQLSPHLAALSLVTSPLMAAAALWFGNPLKRRARLGREAQSRLMSFVHQTLSSIPVVQAFATEERNRDRYRDLAADAVALSQRATLLTSSFGLVTGLITTIGTAVIIYAGGSEVLAGKLSLGSFIVFLSYLRILQGSAENLIKFYGNLKPLEASLDRVNEILAEGREVVEARTPAHFPSSGRAGHVRFDDVTFGYEPGRAVLRGVSFAADPGETVAIVGATGSGKSTLLTLIPRFYDPWEGSITLDGIDLRNARLGELRARIAVLLQEAFLFPGSVADNIAFGRPEATREEIEAAAGVANASAFIEALPRGYDTVIAERGATLSGGERQRLAIARAVLKDAPVLLLDEPTSALDAGTEALVMGALERLMRGRTTFVVAHRLSTIRNATRIVVLVDGRIAESGGHAELIAARGTYWSLYTQQMQGGAS